LAIINLIWKFQVEALVSTMDVPVNGVPHLKAGVLNMVVSLLSLLATTQLRFHLNLNLVVTGALLGSKQQIILRCHSEECDAPRRSRQKLVPCVLMMHRTLTLRAHPRRMHGVCDRLKVEPLSMMKLSTESSVWFK